MKIEIIPTIPAHVRALAKCLREADAREITCLGFLPNRVLWKSYKQTIGCKTGLINGDIAAMFGVVGNPMGNKGIPWLLTSPVVEKLSAIKFSRIYRQEVAIMLKMFPILENYVDASYEKSVRMLKLMGFEIEEPKEWWPGKPLFRKFTRTA